MYVSFTIYTIDYALRVHTSGLLNMRSGNARLINMLSFFKLDQLLFNAKSFFAYKCSSIFRMIVEN